MTNLTVPRPGDLNPRSDFRPEDFIQLIESRGTRLLWEFGDLCPCGSHGGHNDRDCTVCHGSGWSYTEHATPIRGIISGMSDAARLVPEFGMFGWGLSRLSFRAEHTPAYHDRFTLLDGAFLRQEVGVRADDDTQRLALPIRSRTLSLVRNGAVQPVRVFARYLRRSTGAMLGGALLTPGVDFDATAEGLLDWTLGDTLGTAPEVGEKFAISYWASPRYIVKEHGYALRQTDTAWQQPAQVSDALPVQVICRLDFAGGVDADGGGQ